MKKRCNSLSTCLYLLLLVLLSANVHAAAPANDNCSAATVLTVNAAPLAGSTASATMETGEITPCSTGLPGAPTVNQSVWYSFVATSTQHTVVINQISGTCFNMYSSVFRGTCAARQEISCYARNYGLQEHHLNALVVGATYYIQVAFGSSPVPAVCQFKTFDIQVKSGATLGLDLCICGGTEQSSIGTPGTCIIADLKGASSCLGTGCVPNLQKSVSFFFIPTGNSFSVSINNVQGSFTGQAQVQLYEYLTTYTNYKDCQMSNKSSVCAALPFSNTFTGLTAGKQYRIMISTSGNNEGCNTAFAICVNDGAPCAASCSPPPVEPPGGSAYGVYAADGSATVNSAQIMARGGFSGCGGSGTQCLVCTPTDDAYSSVAIAGYPIIDVTNISCLNSVMTFTTTDPTPSWPAGALGANASFTPLPTTTATLNSNQYTATTGRRTINFQGDVNQPPMEYRNTPIAAIPDNGVGTCTSLISSITVANYPCATIATSQISVRLNIEHTYDNDVIAFLIAPNGDAITLLNQVLTGNDNFTNTVFSDAGVALPSTVAAANAAAPFTATYKPAGTTGTLCGTNRNRATFAAIGGGSINPNGSWRLVIFDNFLGDAGTLIDWSLMLPGCSQANQNINYPGFVNMMMAKPSPGAVLGSNKVCPNKANSFGSSVAGTPGYTYQWSTPVVLGNSAIIASPTSSYTNITFANNTVTTLTYITSLTITSECCGPLPVVTYSVQVLPDPAAPSVLNATPTNCVGGTTNLDAVPVAGFTYAWYTTPTGTNLLTSGPTHIVTNTLPGATNYYAETIDAFGCPSTRTQVTLQGTDSPPTVADVSICAAMNVTLPIVSPIPATTYKWYTGSCGGTLLQSNTSIAYTQNFAATTNLYISATEPGCAESSCDLATVTLGAAPSTLYWTGEGATGNNNWFDANNWASSVSVPATTFTNTAPTLALTTGLNPCDATRQRDNTITVSGYSQAIPMAGVSIKVTMSSHARMSDVAMFLIAPSGDTLGLNNRRGNNGACTVTDLTFAASGATSWPAGTCPAAGTTYRPEGATYTRCAVSSTITQFAQINGGADYNPNGVWTLKLVDEVNTNGGAAIAIGDWQIMFPTIPASGACVPSCATNVIIPNTPALAVSNPPDIGFTAGKRAQALNLDLVNGNTLSFSNTKSVLDVCGNFTHTGTLITNDMGLISFIGTNPQTYTNTTSVTTIGVLTRNTFNNVVINNTALTPTVTVRGDMTIGNMVTHTKGILTFINGTILLPPTKRLTIANTANTAISGQAITNYVAHSDQSSILRRYLATTGGSYDFPVGNTNRNSYQLQNLNFNSGHGIEYIDVNFSNPANATGTGLPIIEPLLSNYYAVVKNGGVNATTNNANGGVWTVTPNVAGTATYTTTLYGTNLATVGSTIRHTVLKRTTAGPGPWLLDGTYVSSTLTTPITAVRSGMSGFSQFAIGMSDLVVTLPIKLKDFSVYCNDELVTAKWTTSFEKSKGNFVLERSVNGREFTAVSNVNAVGNSVTKQFYSATDLKPYKEGITYYRLRITDKDGISDFSNVVEITMPCTLAQNIFYIFPNPAKAEANVIFSTNAEGIAYVKVKNAIGQEVIYNKMEVVAGENKNTLNLKGLATGIYMVTVVTDTETMSGKLVVNND